MLGNKNQLLIKQDKKNHPDDAKFRSGGLEITVLQGLF